MTAKIYRIVNGYWSGEVREIEDSDAAPRDWTRSTPPELQEGQVAAWLSPGWAVQAGMPAPGLDALKAHLTAAATAQRWEVETGGVELPGGVRVSTTLADQNRITSVVANAVIAGVTSVDFKAASGWITLTLQELQGIASAIALHVQDSFTAERTHHEAIAAIDSVGELVAYGHAQGWLRADE